MQGNEYSPIEIGYFIDAEEEYERAMADVHRLMVMLSTRNRELRQANEQLENRKAFLLINAAKDYPKETVEARKARVQMYLTQDSLYAEAMAKRDSIEDERSKIDADLEKAKLRIGLHKRRMDYGTVNRNLLHSTI